MKNILLICFTFILFTSTAKSQSYIELVYGNEDKAIGGNILIENILVGYEHGVYKDKGAFSIDHDKYRLGYYWVDYLKYKDMLTETVVSISACYNDYHVNFDHKDRYVPRISCEFSIRGTLYNSVIAGLAFDVVHRTGSFVLGFKIK